jgi:hypothetical protein
LKKERKLLAQSHRVSFSALLCYKRCRQKKRDRKEISDWFVLPFVCFFGWDLCFFKKEYNSSRGIIYLTVTSSSFLSCKRGHNNVFDLLEIYYFV